MITFEQALKAISVHTNVLSTENIPVEDSVHRVLRENIYSSIDMPPFHKSAMDGYALKAMDMRYVPMKLKNIGLIQAGDVFKEEVRKGECVKIMTGAALPDGADAVVMVEDTQGLGSDVEVKKSVRKGENVCVLGEDIQKGQQLLKRGRVISTSDVGVLAAVGKRSVCVTKKPKVALLNTGGEIVPPGHLLRERQIYNSNGPQFLALLKSDGFFPHFFGIAKDDRRELTRKIRKGFRYDLLLISGGVSMGDYDLVPDVLKSLGVKKIFHGVKTKPGKPLFFGKRRCTIVFGIPGNPVSNFLAYYIYIRPTLFKMMGRKNNLPQFKSGTIVDTFYQRGDRKHFVMVSVSKGKTGTYLSPISNHGSADTMALSKAEGFMVVDANTSVIPKGSKVKFLTWRNEND